MDSVKRKARSLGFGANGVSKAGVHDPIAICHFSLNGLHAEAENTVLEVCKTL